MRSRVLGVLLPAAALLAGCGTSSGSPTAGPATSVAGVTCAGTPVPVVVSVDQWGDITRSLGGTCARVTSIFASSTADPHGYEPTPSDAAKFAGARIVVVNGVDYDPWAKKLAESQSPVPTVVDGGVVAGVSEGDNPHLWYNPVFVFKIADAVTAQLKSVAPELGGYFDAQSLAWRTSMKPYEEKIAEIRAVASGRSYGASEGVFDYMAAAVGLVDKTPKGWAAAAVNESDPSPADLAEYETLLEARGIDVLVYNTQTEGNITAALRSTAEASTVPVAEVTESVPPRVVSFLDWQLAQLMGLAKALGL